MNTLKQSLLTFRPEILWLTVGISLAVLPHSQRIPAWMTVMFFSLALWRLQMEKKISDALVKPSLLVRFSRQLLMIIIVIGVFASYGTLVGRDAGVALLILLSGVKLLELKAERDYYVAGFIGMFLILTNFFYSQTILSAIHMLVTVTVIIVFLIGLNDRRDFVSGRKQLLLATSMLFQSIPLLLILFVLFPRVDGPLWGLPKDAHAGITGLDDEMSPGQISQLSLSDEVAFRVEFENDIPEKSALYWRGPVLWYSDGVKWVGDKNRTRPEPVTMQGSPVKYTVTMEATDKNWLYGLEMTASPPEQSFFSHDMQIISRSPINMRKRYELSSFTQFKLPANSTEELERALQLPQGYHPKALALAQSWKKSQKNSREIVNSALQMFNTQEFYYTLSPPLLLDDNIDQFIFETRQGFCEHYAASFVILMRAAGIPARVVTGYQGGSINPVGKYLIVRQHDAHAWTEVWFQDEGWVRVDPTAAVSPARIKEGIRNALPDSIIDIPLALQNNEMARNIWRNISNNLDAINNRWNQWVLGYNNKRQSRFLNHIGFKNVDWRGMTSGLFFLSVLILTLVALHLFKTRQSQTDEARRLYNKFCLKLARCNIKRENSEGPIDFAKRAGGQRKDLVDNINQITELYVASRYQNKKELLLSLRQQIRTFRPARHTKVQTSKAPA
jgi:protein-glutamine gamma-glutamyltransferase